MKSVKTNQKGITLIALIITIIVMLILVGVTVSVALNGGIFGKGEKAAFQTKASTIREQLELAKASRVMDNDGKPLSDYSVIKIGDLEGLDDKTREEYKDKIVVDKDGKICYDPAKVTDEEERAWLEEIGIKALGNIPGSFDWGKFDLNVDTSADYEFEPYEGYVLVMNFSKDGILTVKDKSTNEIMITVDATKEEAGVLEVEANGTKSTLTMYNETDILATPDDGDPVVYVKKTGEDPEPPAEETGDQVYATTSTEYTAYYVLTEEGKAYFIYGSQIIKEYAKYEIYEGTPQNLLNQYTQYADYTITDTASGFNKFIIAYDSLEGTTTDGELVGALNGNSFYAASAVTDSDGKNIKTGDRFALNSSLTLEDILQ